MDIILQCQTALSSIAFLPFSPNQRIYWVYLVTAFLVGYFFYQRAQKKEGTKPSLFAYMMYAFSPKVYAHTSSRHDILFFFTNTIFQILTLFAWFQWVQPLISQKTQLFLGSTIPILSQTLSSPLWASYLLYTVVVFISIDFAVYTSHWMQHKIPLLWAFHQTHHSAQVLQPLTVYRVHPVDNFLSYGVAGLFIGTSTGFLQYISVTPLSAFNIIGTDVFTILFYVVGYNLRHTHIWVNYGPKVSQWLMSPAQHQIHHSNNPKHFDKNIGFALSIWDRMFGTLYIPEDNEAKTIQYGIDPKQQRKYGKFLNLYTQPFVDAGDWLIQALKTPQQHTRFWISTGVAGFAFVVVIAELGVAYQHKQTALPQPNPRVYLENLTWPEVQSALNNGTTSIIIPTGGTEQNGHHMVLGKHNQIIHYTSGRIAEELGNTLVAPVIAYVPEGNILPPKGHMKFSGTLSISENTFKQLLRETAQSLKVHGFKHIYFLGDSGGNQKPQEEVATALTQQWNQEVSNHTQVHSIRPYYFYGGEVWLKERGYSNQAIGSHAGIRDTSELLAISPQGVQTESFKSHATYEKEGSNGSPNLANKDIGRYLIQQKIQNAKLFIQHTQNK